MRNLALITVALGSCRPPPSAGPVAVETVGPDYWPEGVGDPEPVPLALGDTGASDSGSEDIPTDDTGGADHTAGEWSEDIAIYTTSGVDLDAPAFDWIGDLDGDGLDEVVFGDSGMQHTGGDTYCVSGGVYLLSSARTDDGSSVQDTAVAYYDAGGWGDGCLGGSVSTLDFDGDGFPEMVASAWGAGGGLWPWTNGVIYLFAGTDLVAAALDHSGTELDHAWAVLGGDYDRLGAISGLGDLDGDGDDELAVGGSGAEAVWVFEGGEREAGWLELDDADVTISADTEISLGRSADLDGDGLSELITCCEDEALQVAFSGTSVLLSPGLDDWDVRLPTSFLLGGDLDGDGHDDAFGYDVAASRWTFMPGPFAGEVAIDSSRLAFVSTGDELDSSVSKLRDVTADGVPDVVLSNYEDPGDYAYVLDGSALPLSGTLDSTWADGWIEYGCCDGNGEAVGDWNGDGWDDLLLSDQGGSRTRIFLAGE